MDQQPGITVVAPGISVVPVRTPTLPPATHTNTWIVGDGALTVFDPASPYEDEQRRLEATLRERVARGERVELIVLTHHHADHVSGAVALRAAFGVPIAAHRATADLVPLTVDDLVAHDDTLDCGGRTLRAVHTPGHAPGHLVFHDVASNAVIAGDMVAGIGTILIGPDDGDLGQYLDSLARMQRLGASVLLPAHGPSLPHADAVLGFYIAHRHQRTEQIRQALQLAGEADPGELVPAVYDGLDPRAAPIAAVQILAHLRWMAVHGLARPDGDRWRPA